MKMKRIVLMAAFVMGGVVFAWQPPETTRKCRTHADPVLHVEFPNQLGDLQMDFRKTFEGGEDDYSLRYDSEVDSEESEGARYLDLYVYTRDWTPMVDGANERVQDEIPAACEILRSVGYADLKMLDMSIEGKMPKSGLTYMWTSATLKFERKGKTYFSFLLVTAWRNRFLKLHYVMPIIRGKIEPPQVIPESFAKIIAALDDVIIGANEAAKIDVYAIEDPKAALAALRQKWLGVEDRVSQYDMPDFTKKFQELDAAQEWVRKDPSGRAGTLLNVSREGIRLRIEPPVWYYNAACAWGLKGRKEEAFEMLEQAIAAGYNCMDHMVEDSDLKILHGDVRFEKLAAMGRTITQAWDEPKEPAVIKDGVIYLNEKNIYWGFVAEAYFVRVTNVPKDTLIYLDHNSKLRNQAPAEGMVRVEYAEELQDRGRSVGAANFCFVDAETGESIPTILECSAVYDDNLTNSAHSVVADMWSDLEKTKKEESFLAREVLGVYTIGSDYGYLGVDRVSTWGPVPLVCCGAKTEEFVRICAEAWKVMKPEVKRRGGIRQLLGIIRRGQKCVTNEVDFMSGAAMRPAMAIDDLDEEKVLKIARELAKPYPETPLFVETKNIGPTTLACNLFEGKFVELVMNESGHHSLYVPRMAEKTSQINFTIAPGEGELVWKVLQGDASKVRIKNGEVVKGKSAAEKQMTFTVESDYQTAFDVTLADGTKMKSTRVDVGCFRVVDGVASMPAIVSIFYMPAETREYGEDGRLKSIDYTKHQIPGWMPKFCPRADFRDEFHWDQNGQMTGWTRVDADGEEMEFTRDGLEVLTRDELGRPLEARRDLTVEWMQLGDADEYTNSLFGVRCANGFDVLEVEPNKTTLAWYYEYKGTNDFRGVAKQKEPVPFRYRPECCTRADFVEDTGFRLPLLRQVTLRHWLYEGYKFRFSKSDPSWVCAVDYLRSDSPSALKEKGLPVPAKLKKMKFCAWKASSNDVWTVDMNDCEELLAEVLREQPDGASRIYVEPEDGREPFYRSVQKTRILCNMYTEIYAYSKLDNAYRRCTEKEVEELLIDRFDGSDWDRTRITEGEPLRADGLPEGIDRGLAVWQIAEGVYLCIRSRFDAAFASRDYFFIVKGKARAINFSELPSRAIGNAVLRSLEDDAEAINNLAVLLYCEVANSMDYDEEFVISLLKRSADLGCEQAKRNLEVLHFNRGENKEGTGVEAK